MSRSNQSRKVDAAPVAEFDVDMPDTSRRYTAEEKEQLLANLDIEVTHKIRQFESWLADALEKFLIHQEGLISRIPKPVRGMTIREFQKYGGDVQAALKGLQREKLGGGPEGTEIDKLTRKRKWVASQETETGTSGNSRVDVESSRATKNARMLDDNPKTKPGSSTGPGTIQRARLQLLGASNKTPQAARTLGRATSAIGSPSPQKVRPTFGTFGRPPSRPTSPSKPGASTQNSNTPIRPIKLPSSASFNPVLPPKTPHYPNPRLPRLNENMLSLNGSPLANPYGVEMDWFTPGPGEDNDDTEQGTKKAKGMAKANSRPGGREKTIGRANSIFIRRDPSFTPAPARNANGFHSRTNSQASIATSSTSMNHSRTNSESEPYPQSASSPLDPTTPRPLSSTQSHTTLPPSALVAIPTKDGHLLEFNPLQTSPGALDALEGITASAKKQAKEDVGRLVQAAVNKWTIK